MARYNVEGNRLIEELCKKLDVPYRKIGSLVIAFDPSEMQEIQTLYERGIKNGVPDLRILSREEALQMEPNLTSKIEGALYAPSAGVDVYKRQGNGTSMGSIYIRFPIFRKSTGFFSISPRVSIIVYSWNTIEICVKKRFYLHRESAVSYTHLCRGSSTISCLGTNVCRCHEIPDRSGRYCRSRGVWLCDYSSDCLWRL